MHEKLRYRISSITSTSARAPFAGISVLLLTRFTEYKHRAKNFTVLDWIRAFILQILNYIYK